MPTPSSRPATTRTDTGDPLLVAYRHDAHKLTGHGHDTAPDTFAGVPVNQQVPHGADADAAAMSRPSGQPERTVPAHQSRYRLSLLDGSTREDTTPEKSLSEALQRLLVDDDPERLHRRWLTSAVVGRFSESVYYPYTSLKYHTLLVAALLDNYMAGNEFGDLSLVVDPADALIAHRTVYTDEQFALRIGTEPRSNPAAPLGARPWRSWSSVWSRLAGTPLDTDHCRYDRFLDANLRRIGSWSTALQYLEAFPRRRR